MVAVFAPPQELESNLLPFALRPIYRSRIGLMVSRPDVFKQAPEAFSF